MSVKRHILWKLAAVLGVGLLIYPFAKRTFPVRLVRFFLTGQPIMRQIPNDLADDVCRKSRLEPLATWSAQLLARYRAGQVATNDKALYWSKGAVRLAPTEIPGWLSGAWRGAPEVSIRLDDEGNPECTIIGWYLYGLIVGPTNYHVVHTGTDKNWYKLEVGSSVSNNITEISAWYMVQAKPGIYAYSDYK
jgi:hypothetical protein